VNADTAGESLGAGGTAHMTAARRAELEAREAETTLLASRCAARYLMYYRHGCTGKECRKRGHGADMALRDDALELPGLR